MTNINIGDLNIDQMITNIKPTSQKINYQKKRALSGKLKTSYNSVKKSWLLTFELITKSERDLLYAKYVGGSFSFIDQDGISTPNCEITSENFEEELIPSSNGTIYYNITLTIEQQ